MIRVQAFLQQLKTTSNSLKHYLMLNYFAWNALIITFLIQSGSVGVPQIHLYTKPLSSVLDTEHDTVRPVRTLVPSVCVRGVDNGLSHFLFWYFHIEPLRHPNHRMGPIGYVIHSRHPLPVPFSKIKLLLSEGILCLDYTETGMDFLLLWRLWIISVK